MAGRCASTCGTPTRPVRRRKPWLTCWRANARPASTDSPPIDALRSQVVRTKCDVLAFFVEAARRGQTVVGYGAPAKGNTLLNYCGIGPELMPFTVDRSPHKQGLYLPGTRIPVRAPEALLASRPEYVFILPWNLRDEITQQMSAVREWGGRFVVPIPELSVF